MMQAMTKREHLKRLLYWEIAIARKLENTAVRERRFEDANYYSKQAQAAEIRARALLKDEIEWRKP
jgi:DNA-binding transcriptional regulator WhiA